MNVQIHADVNVTLHDVVEVSWTPLASMPMKLAGKTVVQRKRSAPTVTMFPSESMWVCFLLDLSAVDLSSVS